MGGTAFGGASVGAGLVVPVVLTILFRQKYPRWRIAAWQVGEHDGDELATTILRHNYR